jgi:hypothetical protein
LSLLGIGVLVIAAPTALVLALRDAADDEVDSRAAAGSSRSIPGAAGGGSRLSSGGKGAGKDQGGGALFARPGSGIEPGAADESQHAGDESRAGGAGSAGDAGAPAARDAGAHGAHAGAGAKKGVGQPHAAARPDAGAASRAKSKRDAGASAQDQTAAPDGGALAQGGPDGGARPGGRAGREGARGPGADRRPGSEDFVWVARFVPTGGASMEGRVIDADTGAPLARIAVEARLARRLMTTTTNANGVFRMDGMLPSSRVVVWIGGTFDPFVPERTDVRIPSEGQTADIGVVRLLRGDEMSARKDGWVGLSVARRGNRVVVSSVSPWLPADRAQVGVGDLLVSVDGRSVEGLGVRAVTFLLRGPIGSSTEVVAEDRDHVRRTVSLQRVLR